MSLKKKISHPIHSFGESFRASIENYIKSSIDHSVINLITTSIWSSVSEPITDSTLETVENFLFQKNVDMWGG
jgi:hypothetical protein